MAVCLAVVSGCQKYRAKPLVPSEVMAGVERARKLPDEPSGSEKPPFGFARAVELFRAHSPALREVQAEYDTALALAKVKTPLPNPMFEAGPQFGFGPDVAATHRLQPFGSLGFSIPTGGRRKRQDELNRMNAEVARIEILARHRELYLDLRKLYARLALSRSTAAARSSSAESAEKSVAISRRMIEAGLSTALDLGLMELDAARAKTEVLSAANVIAEAEGELSELIGVAPEHFAVTPEKALPEMPETFADLKSLQEQLLANHAGLARLRARYEAVERELHLEIAKQYPDFRIGPSFERETGERNNMLGLTLGIELPIFDRNQQAVAQAAKRREEIRVKYEAAANRALAALERAWRGYGIAAEKLKLLRTAVLPKADSNLKIARKTLEAGTMDALRLLEAERAQRASTVEALETELAVREAWIEMEQAVGRPLLEFPGEAAPNVPELPEKLDDEELL